MKRFCMMLLSLTALFLDTRTVMSANAIAYPLTATPDVAQWIGGKDSSGKFRGISVDENGNVGMVWRNTATATVTPMGSNTPTETDTPTITMTPTVTSTPTPQSVSESSECPKPRDFPTKTTAIYTSAAGATITLADPGVGRQWLLKLRTFNLGTADSSTGANSAISITSTSWSPGHNTPWDCGNNECYAMYPHEAVTIFVIPGTAVTLRTGITAANVLAP